MNTTTSLRTLLQTCCTRNGHRSISTMKPSSPQPLLSFFHAPSKASKSAYSTTTHSGSTFILGRTSISPVLSSSSSSLSSLYVQRASFSSSDDSHSDFAPKRTKIDGVDEAVEMIQEHVKDNPIMLYMKGNPSQPQCGFSAQVVQVLQNEGVDFSSVNVLDYPTIREGVKQFSQWPTIPQLYVNGEFIGGCDIVTELHKSGELKDILKEE